MFHLISSNDNSEVSKQQSTKDLFSKMMTDFMDVSKFSFKTDIKETDDEYVIEAELPGMKKEDINLEINNNYLTIFAKNEKVNKEEEDNYIRKERQVGSYRRQFRLKNVKQDEIKAEYNNGILEINLPKLEEEKDKTTIEIQ